MKLISLKYGQFLGNSAEWKLEEFTFEDINLLVGKNATGKSKILNVLKALAGLLSRDRKLRYTSGHYEVQFDKGGQNVKYSVLYNDGKVVKEKLLINGNTLLDRGPEGKGEINASQFKESMKFQIPIDEIAVLAKRDSIQHPFLDDLYYWGENLIHFYFGTPLGKDHFASFRKSEDKKEELDLKNTNLVVAIFRIGQQRFGEKFVEAIKSDMATIGYKIDNIKIGRPESVTFLEPLPTEPMGLIAKEADLTGITDQHNISQGMFRALSLIIQLRYLQMVNPPSCILIDDIGEGLDYERSSSLIKLLMDKAKQTKVQLIMATNDRFVMNNVPLRYWSIVRRVGNRSVIYNYLNSPKMFEDFELTGLSNFDLFSSNYFLDGSGKE